MDSGLCAIEHFRLFNSGSRLQVRAALCVSEQISRKYLSYAGSVRMKLRAHRYRCQNHIKESTMKTTLLVAMFAIIGLTACEKTTVNPPATTVVNPTVEKTVAVPVGVPGPAGATGATGAPGNAGATGEAGKAGEPGKPGDTVIVVPEKH
jgi:hypothetical protein